MRKRRSDSSKAKEGIMAPQPLIADTWLPPKGALRAFEAWLFRGCNT
jgi:hypothetical protein